MGKRSLILVLTMVLALAAALPCSAAVTAEPKVVRTREQALALLKQHFPVPDAAAELIYQPVRPAAQFGGATERLRTAYYFEQNGRVLDAITGEWTPDSPLRPWLVLSDPVPPPTGPVFTPGALPLDAARGRALAADILGAGDANAVDEENTGLQQTGDLTMVWGGPLGQGAVVFDRETGLVKSARRSVPPDGPRPTQSEHTAAEVRAAAVALVQQYFGMLPGHLELERQNVNPNEFVFKYFLYGLPVVGDEVTVAIDPDTLQWQQFTAQVFQGESVGEPRAAFSPNAAADRFFALQKPTLVYRVRSEWPWRRQGPAHPELELVYLLSAPRGMFPFPFMDAGTGTLLGGDGQAVLPPEDVNSRLDGHPAEGALRFMLGAGALAPEELAPGGTLTQDVALRMLLVAGCGPDPTSAETLRLQGWVPVQFGRPAGAPARPVTRAEFAVWVVRALGFGPLAASSLQVQSAVPDLDNLGPEQRTAIAFLAALKLIPRDEPFRGPDDMTQAEGAALATRVYLARRDAL